MTRNTLSVLILGAVVAGVAVYSAGDGATARGTQEGVAQTGNSVETGPAARENSPEGGGQTMLSILPAYPASWEMSLEEADGKLDFEFVVPTHPVANEGNLTGAFVHPTAAYIAMQFPPPSAPDSPLRQVHIEVFQTPWTHGDPLTYFENEVAQWPRIGKSLYEIDGVPALGVTAHSPDDMEQANAAFLRFVVNGIDVHVSGGEDLDLLIEVAKTILAASPQTHPTG